MERIKGRVFKFGDNIDTDQIYPGRYLELTDHQEIGKHAMEGADPEFANSVQVGDIIVAGTNFGCGSSREHAVITLKNAGVSAVIARSFARIFYRNAINMALLVIEVENLNVNEGEQLTIDLEAGMIVIEGREKFKFRSLPEKIIQIRKFDGIINYYKANSKKGF